MCFGGPPDPPDYGPVAEASERQAELQAEYQNKVFNWSTEESAWLKENVVTPILGTMLPMMQQQYEIATAQWERYQEVFQPLEDVFIQEATDWASPERIERERGKAIASVGQSFQAQRENAIRRLEDYGVDPSMTRHDTAGVAMDIAEAAEKARAGNASRDALQAQGLALKADVANFGRGVPTQASMAANTSLGAAGQGQASGQGYLGTGTNAMMSSAAYVPGQTGALNAWTNALSAGYEGEMAAYNAKPGFMGGLGSMFGAALGSPWVGGALGFAEGGEVDAPGGPTDDAGLIRVSRGEYIVPAHVVRHKGSEFFDKLVSKYHPEGKAPEPKYALPMAAFQQNAPMPRLPAAATGGAIDIAEILPPPPPPKIVKMPRKAIDETLPIAAYSPPAATGGAIEVAAPLPPPPTPMRAPRQAIEAALPRADNENALVRVLKAQVKSNIAVAKALQKLAEVSAAPREIERDARGHALRTVVKVG